MRLFVALDLPANIRKQIGAAIETLHKQVRGVRWARPEGMHVTLKFIGWTEPNRVEAIRKALSSVHSDQPIAMNFSGIGFFPNGKRPRVVWCGIEASSNLAEMAEAIDAVLGTLGIERENRAFLPHLTLARLKSPQEGDAVVRAAHELTSREFGSAREASFHLFQSILKPSGAEYKLLDTFPFVKGVA